MQWKELIIKSVDHANSGFFKNNQQFEKNNQRLEPQNSAFLENNQHLGELVIGVAVY